MNLENCILFKGINSEDINRTLESSDSKYFTYKKDSCIFERDDVPKYMYVLTSGAVQIEKVDLNGKIIRKGILYEGTRQWGSWFYWLPCC